MGLEGTSTLEPDVDERLAAARAHFDEHGYVVIPGYVTDEELAPALEALPQLFPTPEEYHADPTSERNVRYGAHGFAGLQSFPYKAVEWSLLNVAPPLVRLGEVLLGTTDIRLNEAHNWAKYSGAADYEQQLHRDYGNHTMLVPTHDPAFGEVEIFMWMNDVPLDHGPTRVVSRKDTDHLPGYLRELPRADAPEVYAAEVAAEGPAGTVLAYRNDTFHRGAAITAEGVARYALKASFRVKNPYWSDSLNLMAALGPNWLAFVDQATPRMLELLGFPPPGDPYWTPVTYEGVTRRYPNADLTAFAP
jgi:ectoine hydroxylase-related dioxygenase (phytanoyl-CoA dioxygenase family)